MTIAIFSSGRRGPAGCAARARQLNASKMWNDVLPREPVCFQSLRLGHPEHYEINLAVGSPILATCGCRSVCIAYRKDVRVWNINNHAVCPTRHDFFQPEMHIKHTQ